MANTNGKPERGSGIEELLPLDAVERVSCAQQRGHVYRHIFRRITAADWKGFFSNVRMEFADAGRGPLQTIGMDTASLRLYADAILRAEGFEMRDGRKPEEQPSWPRCIPRGHRLLAIDLLMKLEGFVTGEAVVDEAKGTSVRIDALWNEGDPGAMKKYFGLIHRFRSPTAEHRQRLIDAGKAGFMVKGTRRGKAVLPSCNAILISLYDELIEAVDGYSVGGLPLGSREEIVREMDNCHKAICVNEIFPASVDRVN